MMDDKPRRPMRRYSAQIGIHSDTKDGIIRGLRQIAMALESGEYKSFQAVTETGAAAVRLTTNEGMTPEKYEHELLRFRQYHEEEEED